MTQKKIKPLCLCAKCGTEVIPTKKEAGQFLIQFRKTPYDTEHLKRIAKLGGRKKKQA